MASSEEFQPNRIVTLTTDFGTADAYVGAMKGVMLRVAPDLRLHDVSHEIPPQDVTHGARVLRGACPSFPAGTVHLAVVDPGVGTDRAAVAVVAGGHAFVGPDNGLFSEVIGLLGGGSARRIDRTTALAPFLPTATSATFHGRDLFAPVAAGLASGRVRFAEIGAAHSCSAAPIGRRPRGDAGVLAGRVTHHDRFGNAITDVAAAELGARQVRVVLPDGTALGLSRTYGDAPDGTTLALIGSEGFLEIALAGGDARGVHGLAPGATVRIEIEPSE